MVESWQPIRFIPLQNVEKLILRQSIRSLFCSPASSLHLKIVSDDESIMYSVCVKLGCVKLKNVCFDAWLVDENREIVFKCEKTFSRMSVWSDSGVIGIVTSSCNCLCPNYSIRDPGGEDQYEIKAPFSILSRFSDLDYHVLTVDGMNRIASITKLCDGFSPNYCSSTRDKFVIHFPADLPPHLKAVILAATVLIDVSFFE